VTQCYLRFMKEVDFRLQDLILGVRALLSHILEVKRHIVSLVSSSGNLSGADLIN